MIDGPFGPVTYTFDHTSDLHVVAVSHFDPLPTIRNPDTGQLQDIAWHVSYDAGFDAEAFHIGHDGREIANMTTHYANHFVT